MMQAENGKADRNALIPQSDGEGAGSFECGHLTGHSDVCFRLRHGVGNDPRRERWQQSRQPFVVEIHYRQVFGSEAQP